MSVGVVTHIPLIFFLIGLIYFLVTSVNEITARQSTLRQIDNLYKSDLEDGNKNLDKITSNLATKYEAMASAARNDALKTNMFKPNDLSDAGMGIDKNTTIKQYRSLKNKLTTLSAIGAGQTDNDLLTASIMRELTTLIDSDSPDSRGNFTNQASAFALWYVNLENFAPIVRLRSDNLLAIAMTCAGIIGAFTAAYRKRVLDPKVDETASKSMLSSKSILSMTLEAVIIGVGSGILTFLMVKGGKGAFFLEMNGEVNAVNPYSATLAALVAGLFTDKFYNLLRELVDKAIERVKGVADENTPPSSKSDPAK